MYIYMIHLGAKDGVMRRSDLTVILLYICVYVCVCVCVYMYMCMIVIGADNGLI